jgi:hypothetical protein
MSSRSGPVKFSHLFESMNPRENGAFWCPPSCRSSTIVVDLLLRRSADERVDRVGLVEEVEAGDAGRRDDQRRALQRLADESDLLACRRVTIWYCGRSGLSCPGRSRSRPGTGRRSRERRAVLAAVDRMAAVGTSRDLGGAVVLAAAGPRPVAVLHPEQLRLPFVELMVADADRVEPHVVS